MARYIYIALTVSFFISANLFFSCSKIDDGDHTPPTIQVFSPIADTIIHVYRDTDTIFPVFRARFTDDTGLSSYTFRILHGRDTISSLAPGDTSAYLYKSFQSVSIFDTTEVTISQIFIVDSLTTVVSLTDNTSKTLPIWEGRYNLAASVVDMQGNVTHADTIPIYIKYRSKN